MRPPTFALLTLCVAIVTMASAGWALAATPWNHDPESAIGPAHWGTIDPAFEACATGTSQSPVNIAGAVRGGGPPLLFSYHEHELVVENTGHVIEVPMPTDAPDTLRVGNTVYTLIQYHFHAPSEHTIAGRHFDLELHLVHESASGGLAVVGVLMDIGDDPNHVVDVVLEHAPAEAGEETEVGVGSNPTDLLPGAGPGRGHGPAIVGSYFTYSGSLTTPACSEPVRWFVAKDPVSVSEDAVVEMHERVSDFPGYEGFPDNNRPVQPRDDRLITSRG